MRQVVEVGRKHTLVLERDHVQIRIQGDNTINRERAAATSQ